MKLGSAFKLAACSLALGTAGCSHSEIVGEPVPGEFLVMFKANTRPGPDEAVLGRHRGKAHRFGEKNLKPNGVRGPEVFDRLVHVVLDDERDSEGWLKGIRGHPDVEYVEPNFAVHGAQAFPNDLDFSRQWGMHNTGQTGGTPDADADAPEAWTLGTGSAQTVVAIIDSGIAYDHPDLASNTWVNSGEIEENGLDDDGNGFVDDRYGYDFANNDPSPLDDLSHGTHVAGSAGAIGNNGHGVAGMCWTVRLMALKFLTFENKGTTANAIKCILYAINNGAHILNHSWGQTGYSQALQDVIFQAHQSGVLSVAAAMNSNTILPYYPAAMQKVLAVSATDHSDARASFSNYGDHIAVAAPGVDIYSTVPGVLSDSPLGSYGYSSGTSMSCPHVSGLAALMKSRNPALTPDLLTGRIEGSADDLGDTGWDRYFGFGRINARRAMERADVLDATPPSAPKLVAPKNGGSLKVAALLFDWSDVTDLSGVRYQLQADNNAGFPSPEIDVSDLARSRYDPPGTLARATYYWRVRAVDGAGNVGAWSSVWKFKITG